jgi:EAL domain-containing protein (putative c-di-GMP-specific phosphodiesterase class I)
MPLSQTQTADVLIIENDHQHATQLQDAFERRGHSTLVADVPDNLKGLLKANPHLPIVVMDLYLGDADAVDILGLLRQSGFDGEILLTSDTAERTLQAVRRLATDMGLKITAMIAKPYDSADLVRLVTQKLDANRPPSVQQIADGVLRGEMVALFQPQIDIASGRLLGAEALVRWRQEDGTLWSPDRFLNTAETGGLMPAITQTMLEQSIAAARLLLHKGLEASIAVNASASVLTDRTFVQQLFERLNASSLPSQAIKIEVTESLACTNDLAIAETLTRLRLRGIALSLDDFGTGYSSLVALHRMPFSELKIDQSFVRDLGHDRDASTIAGAVIDLAHSLGLSVCAEGIENEQALNFLRQRQCTKGQGWYYGRPVTLDRLLAQVNRDAA